MSPRLYTDANPKTIAYVLDGGGSGYQSLPDGHTNMEAEYLAVIYGLNEYFLSWNRELDARQANMDRESLAEASQTGRDAFYNVGSPSDSTPRPLPPAVLVCCDNEVVVKQLSRQYHIGNDKLRKLAQRVWQMTQNVEVKYQWIPRKENLAGKMLK
ncbi:hypothetical protein LCGC14_0409010 [marine sediment metagenome]|uniref:RNase H type-1 domain-containing protein n=1 Tax=marine sediment metagenome TaxID=412755 RepID=A0A0F9T092_9ZZZZ